RALGRRGDCRGHGRGRTGARRIGRRGPGGRRSDHARASRPPGRGTRDRHGVGAAVSTSGDVRLLVVRLSDSFGDFWPALAREVGAPLVDWTPGADEPPPPDAAVLLVAAGGGGAGVIALLAQPLAGRGVPTPRARGRG